MPKVLMYSTAVCPFCVRAEQLLKRKGVTEIEKVRVDLEPERREEMMQKTGRRTVPQVYIGATHVLSLIHIWVISTLSGTGST